MKYFKKRALHLFTLALLAVASLPGFSQVREYFVMDRGMLWETVYNTGVISRPWANRGNEDGTVILPQFEWPGNSATITEGIEYYGQHNSKGQGMWIVASPADPAKWDIDNRLFAFCGAIGEGDNPFNAIGVYSFPIEFRKIENYPILADGTLNPDYDPAEAELVVIARWGTPTGIEVTRISRQWSYPDYDDFIIHEYSLEFTGNTDDDASTIEMSDINALTDVFVSFNHCLAPSLYGYMRHYREWKWKPGVHAGDNWSSFDTDYWLSFNSDRYTGAADKKDNFLRAKPEPIPELFMEQATTGEKGGGLLSPQAVGFSVLYYDTEHLIQYDADNPDLTSSALAEGMNSTYLDGTGRVMQPWELDRTVGWNRQAALMEGGWGAPSIDRNRGFKAWSDHPDDWWIGRDMPFNNIKTNNKGIARFITFGTYRLNKGERIDFTIAQVAGYSAEAGKEVAGGYQNAKQLKAFPSLDKKVVLGGETMTENYLTDFGYPDYVNSEVRNVTQVAHKAFEAYTGQEMEYSNELAKNPMRPEDNPRDGVYAMDVPPPAPVITAKNTATGEVRVTWTNAAEQFIHPNLTGPPAEYRIYRSYGYIGPWELLGTINPGNTTGAGIYEYLDEDDSFTIGSTGYYAVTSVDAASNESGKPSIVEHVKNVGAVEQMTQVYVAPNPFVVESGYPGAGEEDMIGFFALPETCTIRIFSFAGQLIQTIEHDDPVYNHTWFQVTRNQQAIASGVYFYTVTTPEGDTANGKFLIIK